MRATSEPPTDSRRSRRWARAVAESLMWRARNQRQEVPNARASERWPAQPSAPFEVRLLRMGRWAGMEVRQGIRLRQHDRDLQGKRQALGQAEWIRRRAAALPG